MMVNRCRLPHLERTERSECVLVFQGQSVQILRVDLLPFVSEPVENRVQQLCQRKPIRSKWVPHDNEVVTTCTRLCCAWHGTVLSLKWPPSLLLSECGSDLNFFHDFSVPDLRVNHQPVSKISGYHGHQEQKFLIHQFTLLEPTFFLVLKIYQSPVWNQYSWTTMYIHICGNNITPEK